jgi:hypothetical protein
VNVTLAALVVAAFWLTHTPPPVVPTYNVFPVESDGSSASDEIRPVTNP